MSNRVKILFFATLKDLAGVKEVSLEIPDGAPVAQLKKILIEQYPAIAPAMTSALVAINRTYALDADLIPEGAEIAFFPPVSGGSDERLPAPKPGGSMSLDQPTILALTENELDLNQVLAQITLPTTGAVCFFTGIVRGVTTRGDAHETSYLEYEAYPSMAESKMRQVADEIRARWPSVQGIAIVQRTGLLKPGTPTVLIGCTAAHRDMGVFEASRYGIDRLKEIVPIWKKEVSPHGEHWVAGDYVPKAGE